MAEPTKEELLARIAELLERNSLEAILAAKRAPSNFALAKRAA